MNSKSDDKKKSIERDPTEIIIERIRKKNAEFVNLNKIFLRQSRKIRQLNMMENPGVEREL